MTVRAPSPRNPLPVEGRAREACQAGQVNRATTMLLEAYGPELLGFLRLLLRDATRADDVFSDVALDIWRGLVGFDWESSARTWLYVLARRAAARYMRARQNKPMERIPESSISDLVQRLRTETAPYLRTDVKDEFAKLREHLAEDDQILLVLRVDRRMAWREVTVIMADQGLDENEREALEARLRKRFQAVKDRLRKLAKESGLLSR
jgi:RNA polymerase sigma-70 factor, ECF subfamily